jgi:putative DNA primase/helicase
MSDEQDDDEIPTPPMGLFDDEDEGPSTEELRLHAPRTTDSANADAVVREHGRGFRYVLDWNAWLAWDGKRWDRAGARQRLIHFAMLTARTEHYATEGRLRVLYEARRVAALQGAKDDKVEKKITDEQRLLKWHEQSQNSSKLEAVAKLLESRLQVTLSELDRDPWLLNVLNGTLDLRTAELRTHSQDDLITQIAHIEWNEHDRAPTWEAFVYGAMGGKLELVLYLQRLVGYSLTALTTEHLLAFFYGGGSNGKSTFVQAIREMLGEYACAAPRELLFERKGSGEHATELARLYGKRMVACSEIGEHTILDEAKVKDLTGGDAISARRMREDYWDFRPTHTLFISGNHKPTVRGNDHGIWRRIRLVPWTVQVEKEAIDKDLPEKLRRELPGILRWCVQGCLEWQRIGLHEPDDVIEATKEYRSESDALGQFLVQYTVIETDARISRKALREKYESWCEEIGYQPLGAKKFAQRLKEEKGVKDAGVRESGKVMNGWAGIRLKTMLELIAESEPSNNSPMS